MTPEERCFSDSVSSSELFSSLYFLVIDLFPLRCLLSTDSTKAIN